MRNKFFFVAILVSIFLVSCQPLSATVVPTPQVIHIQLASEMTSWQSKLSACSAAISGIGLIINEKPADNIDISKADVSIRFGLPTDYDQLTPAPVQPVQLGKDSLVVIVNPDNPISKLSLPTISKIFSGQITRWTELSPRDSSSSTPTAEDTIQVWTYQAGDNLLQVFDQTIMQGQPVSSQAYVAPDTSAMLQVIAQNKDSIGYILASQVGNSVQEIQIEGSPTGQLEQPVLAFTSTAPEGLLKQFLLCLQEK